MGDEWIENNRFVYRNNNINLEETEPNVEDEDDEFIVHTLSHSNLLCVSQQYGLIFGTYTKGESNQSRTYIKDLHVRSVTKRSSSSISFFSFISPGFAMVEFDKAIKDTSDEQPKVKRVACSGDNSSLYTLALNSNESYLAACTVSELFIYEVSDLMYSSTVDPVYTVSS